MNKFLKSHILFMYIGLSLATFLSFWAPEKDKCFEIKIREELGITVNCN